ncbi:MAG: hypothetical protein Q4E43_04640 [Akkermansia sp.]|nr:hypothetical protein [Akkermansia sp.]
MTTITHSYPIIPNIHLQAKMPHDKIFLAAIPLKGAAGRSHA